LRFNPQIVLENEEGRTLLWVTDTNSNLPLHAAAAKGHVDPLEMILDHGGEELDVNAENINRKTAMHLAAEKGHTE
jgi:ankyrin repeat protein